MCKRANLLPSQPGGAYGISLTFPRGYKVQQPVYLLCKAAFCDLLRLKSSINRVHGMSLPGPFLALGRVAEQYASRFKAGWLFLNPCGCAWATVGAGKADYSLIVKGNVMDWRKPAFCSSLIVSVLLLFASGSAFAQATRTWVSGVGDDVNPCSRTAPCKTWAGAISKTAAGGMINCIDPGGYGTVTITKSITISCKHVEGSALASSTTGLIINGAGIEVVLRGLDIDGSPPTSPGINGIRFLQGASLIVEDCIIRDFDGAAPNGNGIIVNNTALTPIIHVSNSYITGNGAGTAGAGIQIIPSGTGGARVTVTNTVFSNNTAGVRADSAGTSGAINVTVTDSTAAGAAYHGFVALGAGGQVQMMLNRVVVANNLGEGVRSVGANAIVRIGSSAVTANGTGLVAATGGQILSYGNNQINGNTTDGTATGVALK